MGAPISKSDSDVKIMEIKQKSTIVGIAASLFVLTIHVILAFLNGLNDSIYYLSWGQRNHFIFIEAFHTGKLDYILDIVGFPRTEFGSIPNSIMYGVLIGLIHYIWNWQKNFRLRQKVMKELAKRQRRF